MSSWSQLLHPAERLPADLPLEAWYDQLLSELDVVSPFTLALLGGRRSATPGLAFLAGYQGALRALWPAAPLSLGALCVTEQRSTRPADLQTRVQAGRLNGRKDFVTAGAQARWLLVAARCEADGTAPQVQLLVLRPPQAGLELTPLPATGLMPDISHARLQLQNVLGEGLLGDGWSEYVKPFRTLEDGYVLAAMAGWLSAVGEECQWPQTLRLQLLGLIAGCAQVMSLDPQAPSTHLLLAGLLEQFVALATPLEAALDAGPAHWAALWRRDRGVMNLGGQARQLRLTKALQNLGLAH